ncbi:hypothetical protein FQA47_004012 [Oryzias melastigma]|uniref:Uncharacterized protein n=1 Tax=Oryzias melastigma TaxID=30732 RepID=A0A834C8N9_ORYME|nr:hypothetical protein FQA47_004012 [Oryzias melastigma]
MKKVTAGRRLNTFLFLSEKKPLCLKRYFLNICKISYFVQYLLFYFEVPEDRHQSRECLTLSCHKTRKPRERRAFRSAALRTAALHPSRRRQATHCVHSDTAPTTPT